MSEVEPIYRLSGSLKVKSYMVTTWLSVETALDILYNCGTESVGAAPSLLILIFNITRKLVISEFTYLA